MSGVGVFHGGHGFAGSGGRAEEDGGGGGVVGRFSDILFRIY